MKDPVHIRQRLLELLQRDLVGPANGETEVLDDQPRIRYLAGVLFPQESTRNDSETAGGVEELPDDSDQLDSDSAQDLNEYHIEPNTKPDQTSPSAATELDTAHDDTLTMANSFRPSAMGLSFFVCRGDLTLSVDIAAAEYVARTEDDKGFKKTKYSRRQINANPIEIDLSEAELYPMRDWDIVPGLRLKGVFRKRANGQVLVTLSIYNTSRGTGRNSRTFYQVSFRASSPEDKPVFVEYQTAISKFEDSEQAGLSLLYRRRREYAVGHGCAAAWGQVEDNGTASVFTTALPNVVVPPVNPVSHNAAYLDMHFLRGGCPAPTVDIPNALNRFCDDYEAWLAERELESPTLSTYNPAPSIHVTLGRTALTRMRRGIELLRSDDKAMTAFMLANRVMLMQQHHASRRRNLRDPWQPLPRDESYFSAWNQRRGYWRTFQIGFIIMNLVGLSDQHATITIDGSDIIERDLVDLIWFPTGGGKTEAYLGLAAYLIFLRRLQGEDVRGCKVLMRYTLRLLTTQQFQRAASLICACEIVRRESPELYGDVPISIGLYVGKSLTPNKEKDALNAISRMARKGKDEKNPFQLLHW